MANDELKSHSVPMTENIWNSLDVAIDSEGTWLCEHTDESGRPAPATRLRYDQTLDWSSPGAVTSAQRRYLYCPDCGTYWRVWVGKNLARPSIEWNAERQSKHPPRYFRPQRFDIDRIIHAVRQRIPSVDVRQIQGTYPADDEGRWTFSLAGVDSEIAVESDGNCPFSVDTDEQYAKETLRASSVDETVTMLSDYLVAASSGSPIRLKGELYWK